MLRNPFSKVKTQKSSVKVNEFVPREVVDKLMKKASPVWQVILGLSRNGGIGFQPVCIVDDYDKLEAYPTRPWHLQRPDLS